MARMAVLGWVVGLLGVLAVVWAHPPAEHAKVLGLPEGTVPVGSCVPGMGEHWAQPQNLPFGPIYGVMKEKVVFVEIMVSQADFAAGKSWTEALKPLTGHAVDHVDLEFLPKGHEGYEVPHYDIHAYFVSHQEHLGNCPAPKPVPKGMPRIKE